MCEDKQFVWNFPFWIQLIFEVWFTIHVFCRLILVLNVYGYCRIRINIVVIDDIIGIYFSFRMYMIFDYQPFNANQNREKEQKLNTNWVNQLNIIKNKSSTTTEKIKQQTNELKKGKKNTKKWIGSSISICMRFFWGVSQQWDVCSVFAEIIKIWMSFFFSNDLQLSDQLKFCNHLKVDKRLKK